MLQSYESQLNKITDKINSCFIEQEEYIKCAKGCSICCKNGYYPASELEYKYVRKGIETLYSQEQIKSLQDKVWEIYKNRKNFLKTNSDIHDFVYECPFLDNESCSIYEYRPITCRTYGLITKDSIHPEKKNFYPYCRRLGLNYSNVWDSETKRISNDIVKALGLKNIPVAYDLSYSSVMKLFEDMSFGDVRMLYEWIIMDIPDYEILMKSF